MNRTPWEIAVWFFISTQSANNTQLNVISRKLRIPRRDLQRVAQEFVREPQPPSS